MFTCPHRCWVGESAVLSVTVSLPHPMCPPQPRMLPFVTVENFTCQQSISAALTSSHTTCVVRKSSSAVNVDLRELGIHGTCRSWYGGRRHLYAQQAKSAYRAGRLKRCMLHANTAMPNTTRGLWCGIGDLAAGPRAGRLRCTDCVGSVLLSRVMNGGMGKRTRELCDVSRGSACGSVDFQVSMQYNVILISQRNRVDGAIRRNDSLYFKVRVY